MADSKVSALPAKGAATGSESMYVVDSGASYRMLVSVLKNFIAAGDLAGKDTVGTADIDVGSVTLEKLADIANSAILGNNTGGAAAPLALTATEVRTVLNVGDGAQANPTTASQAEMETGTETELRSMSPLLVAQAIAQLSSGDVSVTVAATPPSAAPPAAKAFYINTAGPALYFAIGTTDVSDWIGLIEEPGVADTMPGRFDADTSYEAKTAAEIGDFLAPYSAVSSSSGALTLNLASKLAGRFGLTLTENVTSITISNVAASGNWVSLAIKVVQDATARTITWPASFIWDGGSAPTLSTGNGDIDMFGAVTHDGGTTWHAFIIGQGFA